MGSSIKNLPSIIYYELMKNYASVPYVPASIQVKDVSVYVFASARALSAYPLAVCLTEPRAVSSPFNVLIEVV